VDALRCASSLLRGAVNSTVHTVALQLYTAKANPLYSSTQVAGQGNHRHAGFLPSPLELNSDLGASFPNAVEMKAELALASSPLELVCVLGGLCTMCPILVSRLQRLHLELRADHLESNLAIDSVTRFLSR
jgi:hypothetical protein